MVSKKSEISAPAGYGIHADHGDIAGEFCEPFLLPISLLEQLGVEALERERLAFEEADFNAVEDSMVRMQNFLAPLPDGVVVTSTSEFLDGLNGPAARVKP